MLEDPIEAILKEINELKKKIDAFTQSKQLPLPCLPLVPSIKRPPLFGGKHGAVRILDTATGITYRSKGECGRVLAPGEGFDPENHFIYYKIRDKHPGRFKELD